MAVEEDEVAGVPEWVVTYGDMMSLLLTFFIMLVSMSELKEEGKNRAMLDALQKRFGPTASDSGMPGRSLQTHGNNPGQKSKGKRSEGGVKTSSRKSPGPGGAQTTVRRISHGTVVTMGGPALFEKFDAKLNDALKTSLDAIVQAIATKPNRMIIRGHASAQPLPDNAEFDDPLQLSFARAHNVAQYLIDKGIDRRRLLVSAVGAAEPRVTTRNEGEHRRNRRVDVFLIDSYISPSQSSESEIR